jgi:hypothetical protein
MKRGADDGVILLIYTRILYIHKDCDKESWGSLG